VTRSSPRRRFVGALFVGVLFVGEGFVAFVGASSQAAAQELPFSGSNVALTPPCVRAADDVWCWGAGGGGFSLAPVPALRGVRGLVARGAGVCGVRGSEVVCGPEDPNPGARRARALSHEGQARCTVGASGVVECPEGARVAARGRVLSVLFRPFSCGSVHGERAIVLRSDGRVTVEGCGDGWHRALRDVVQMEASSDLFCTRHRSGAVACVDLEGSARLEPRVLASFDGRTGYTDLAVSSRTVCALHETGVVSCASGDSRREGAGRGGVYVLPQSGVRDIAFHENELCLLDASGVDCEGLGGEWWGVPARIPGLPPVRRAAIGGAGRDRGCAIDRQGALWCWDERAPVRRREGVRAVTLVEETTFTVDSEGTLRAEGRRGPGVSLVGFWPRAPDDLVLRADALGDVSQGDATVVCGAAGQTGQEVRCAEVRFRGVSPTSLVALPTPTDAQRAWIRRRDGRSEIDASGTWWSNDFRGGVSRRVRLRDDVVWADGVRGASVLFAIDRDGALWITASRLRGRLPAPHGLPGPPAPPGWVRFTP
jgi:hypothetical protein